MQIQPLADLRDLILLTPRRFGDARGWFSETYNAAAFKAAGIGHAFCQDNESWSAQRGILRGLHFQAPPSAQAKLVRCTQGAIWDMAVDIRRGSPTFGRHAGATLTAEEGQQLFIPAGFAHAFVVLSDGAKVAYKVDAFYDAAADGGILWDDPDLGIAWPVPRDQILTSDKDARLPRLRDLASPFIYGVTA